MKNANVTLLLESGFHSRLTEECILNQESLEIKQIPLLELIRNYNILNKQAC